MSSVATSGHASLATRVMPRRPAMVLATVSTKDRGAVGSRKVSFRSRLVDEWYYKPVYRYYKCVYVWYYKSVQLLLKGRMVVDAPKRRSDSPRAWTGPGRARLSGSCPGGSRREVPRGRLSAFPSSVPALFPSSRLARVMPGQRCPSHLSRNARDRARARSTVAVGFAPCQHWEHRHPRPPRQRRWLLAPQAVRSSGLAAPTVG